MATRCVYGVRMSIHGYDSILRCCDSSGYYYLPRDFSERTMERTIIYCTQQHHRHIVCDAMMQTKCLHFKPVSVLNTLTNQT